MQREILRVSASTSELEYRMRWAILHSNRPSGRGGVKLTLQLLPLCQLQGSPVPPGQRAQRYYSRSRRAVLAPAQQLQLVHWSLQVTRVVKLSICTHMHVYNVH